MSFRHSLPMMMSATPTSSTTFTNYSNGLSNGSPKKSSPRKTAKVGDSVTIDDGKSRGYLRFLGPTEFREGVWAGVELEKGQKGGRHDGMVDSVRYFKCPAGQGIFVHPSNVHYVSSPPAPVLQEQQEQQSSNPRESILPPFNDDGEEEGAAAKSQIHLELDKRSKELLLARDALHRLRKLNTTDPPTILLSVDHLDRSMGRYERQLRRFILEVKSSSKAEINCIQSKMELLQQQLLLKEQQEQQFLQQQQQEQQEQLQHKQQEEENENENQRIKKLHHDYNDLYEAKERQERYMQERIDFLEKELKSFNENTVPLNMASVTSVTELQSLTEVQEAHKKKISDLERQLKERNEALARVEKDFSSRNQEEIENLYALLKKKDDMLELAEEELLSLSRRADLKEKEYDSGIGAGGRQASLLRAQLSEAESLLRQQAELIESISANGGLQGNHRTPSDTTQQKDKKTKNNNSSGGNEEELQKLCKWQDDRIALLEAELEEKRAALEMMTMKIKKNTANKEKEKDRKSTSDALTDEAAKKILGEIVNIDADSLLGPLRDLALFVKDFKPHNVDLRRLDSEMQSILKELPECPHYLGNSGNDGDGGDSVKDEDFTDTTIRIDGMMKKSAESLLREPF